MPETDNITLEKKIQKTPGNPPFPGKCSRSFFRWSGLHIFAESCTGNTWRQSYGHYRMSMLLHRQRTERNARFLPGKSHLPGDMQDQRIRHPGVPSESAGPLLYLQKSHLYQTLGSCKARHMNMIVEGSNMDDLGDYRPGKRAIQELGVRSPLQEAGLYKEEIRELSKDMNLPTWNKPSFACLASRFVYGEPITEEKLHMVDQAEQFLMDLGFHQFRVRIHGTMARIEVPAEEILKIADNETRRSWKQSTKN